RRRGIAAQARSGGPVQRFQNLCGGGEIGFPYPQADNVAPLRLKRACLLEQLHSVEWHDLFGALGKAGHNAKISTKNGIVAPAAGARPKPRAPAALRAAARLYAIARYRKPQCLQLPVAPFSPDAARPRTPGKPSARPCAGRLTEHSSSIPQAMAPAQPASHPSRPPTFTRHGPCAANMVSS